MEKYIEQFVNNAIDYAPTLLLAVGVLVVGWWVIGIVSKTIRKSMSKSKLDKSLQTFVYSLLNIGLKIMLVISAASMIGIETTSFVAVLGAASFAVGLALQGSLSNFAGGVLILFFKPFKVGDLIEAQGFKGVVKEIGIFVTTLASPAGRRIIVPNGALSNGSITNFTSDEKVCVDLTFGIGYSDDIDKAKAVLKQVVDSCPYILKDEEAAIYVAELADSSVNFIVRPWSTVGNYWDAYFFLHENVKKEFDKNGVGIPFPQMDVHLKQS